MHLRYSETVIEGDFLRHEVAISRAKRSPQPRERHSVALNNPANTRLTGWDYSLLLLALALSLTITLKLSRGRSFWEDEMLGWIMLRDPSWHHMLYAYRMGADGGGFLFYLTGRAWFQLFGPTEIAFRLYSCTCFGLAFIATWIAARRFYPVGIVCFALFNTWFFSPPFIFHMTEGRFYGLLILGVSLALWITLVLADVRQPAPRRFYGLLFLAHAVLTTSHLLGVVFSAFLVGATVLLDVLQSRRRPLLYMSGMAAWLLLLPERANILASARVGKPHFWTKAPTLQGALAVFTGSSHEIAAVLAVLLVVALWKIARSGGGAAGALRRALAQRLPVYVVIGAMLLLSLAFATEGLVGTWLFNDRYLLPITIVVAYITAELLQLIKAGLPEKILLRRTPGAIIARFAGAICFISALLFWDFHHLAHALPSPNVDAPSLTAKLPPGIPVVCEDAFTFLEVLPREHGSGVQYVFLLDWVQSVSASAPRLEVTQYHLLENWKKVGYFSGSIVPIQPFLQRYSEFLVVHASQIIPNRAIPEIGNPLAQRFQGNPAYVVRPYTIFDQPPDRYTVWLVCRDSCKEQLLPPSGRARLGN